MNADFVANKIPVEFIKEEAFWGTYSRDIYFGVNGTRYRETWKTLMSYSIMIKIISTQIIKVLMLIDVKSNL